VGAVEEFEKIEVGDFGGIENDLSSFGVYSHRVSHEIRRCQRCA
jgi:hypothetical protein